MTSVKGSIHKGDAWNQIFSCAPLDTGETKGLVVESPQSVTVTECSVHREKKHAHPRTHSTHGACAREPEEITDFTIFSFNQTLLSTPTATAANREQFGNSSDTSGLQVMPLQ